MAVGPRAAPELLRGALAHALEAVDPARVLGAHLPPPPKGRLVVVGAGKAAAAMAWATEAHLRAASPEAAVTGLVITRYGHLDPARRPERLEVVEAAHPVPDAAGVEASSRILALAASLREDDLLLCLLSGGGSALLCAPEGVTLAEKAALTRALLRSGAEIGEMNAVRKHLSRVKGGGLARAASPARVVSLILSDVPGDDLAAVASGPTVPDPTTFGEALEVLTRYEIDAPAARAHLERGARGEVPETPKPGDPLFARVENRLVGSAQGMLEAAAAWFAARGVTPLILGDAVTGEAREVAKVHAAVARQIKRYGQPVRPPAVLLSGGETSVTVRGPGRGGRNLEFALSLALSLGGLPDVYALAADTDGVDGTEDAAGALVTPATLGTLGPLAARRYLGANDAYTFFERAGGLVKTGPTLTNVNDVRMVLVDDARGAWRERFG
ncbi:glycerate kinase type-2 family protein [Truepera radiovictrix]|uniref:Hydroxypyruvate reductase n=1 Tax=Truepera radiovictrix (strain DSM 17093 / CIP 108686 / LMG 22925 / RQ-24) TaxID=649638 RepID=D7CW89_TRURR|nr:glycerate kinase [Truepera radiovictrix]ADI16039.1 Hydroxypyruvate reductase [Truepera radiovictrix DSM 17093]WMT58333.1 glycerate kinase [Truepera radiovictrix]